MSECVKTRIHNLKRFKNIYLSILIWGRFYSGDISGKFWFGVQSSDDISTLVPYVPIQNYIWKSCGCYVDEEIREGKYCKDCYDSIDSHILEVKEEENYEDGLLYMRPRNYL